MNKFYLIGNLTRDPELKTTTNGISVARFSLAVNRRYKKDGVQQVDYFNIVAWRQLADLCGRYLAKGRKVAIVGAIETRTYEAQDGSKRTAFDFVADEVEFLSSSKGESSSGYSAPAADTNYAAAAGFTPADVSDDELPF